MTSVPFNIGLDSERRSSRVLMPPGGRNSDIFGTATADPQVSGRRRNINGRPDSNIMNIPEENQNGGNETESQEQENIEQKPESQEEASATNPTNGQGDEKPSSEEKKDDSSVAVGKGDETKTELKKDDKLAPPPKSEGTPIRRGRIPPGGFSTKLW